MLKRTVVTLFMLLIWAAMPLSVRAESVEKQFDSFFSQQEKFAKQDKQKREEGYVLERVYDPAGNRRGQLSLGGGPDPEPVYGGTTNYNFGGRDFSEPESGILNLRLKF